MSLITNHDLVRLHVEELRRETAHRRHVVGRVRADARITTRVRTAAGGWLIGLGNRLLPHPSTEWSAPALGHSALGGTQRRMP